MHVKLVQAALLLLGAGSLGVLQKTLPPSPVVPRAAQLAPHGVTEDAMDYLAGNGVYTSPNLPVPRVGNPDVERWVKTSQQIFLDVRQDSLNGFLTRISRQGLWVTGLPFHPRTLHVTPLELSQDLHRHGSLYRAIFLDHRSGNFVVGPDDAGQVVTMMLK